MKIIGSKIFNNIETNDEVDDKLTHFLYCKVFSDSGCTSYKISLMNILEGFRKCPSCGRIYIISNFGLDGVIKK